MFCLKCGTALPDDANFCLKCGTPQRKGVQVEPTQWETCEIAYEMTQRAGILSGGRCRFWASAIGPSGRFTAKVGKQFFTCTSQDWPPDYDYKKPHAAAQKTLDELIAELLADGWQSTGTCGTYWWQYSFRRPCR